MDTSDKKLKEIARVKGGLRSVMDGLDIIDLVGRNLLGKLNTFIENIIVNIFIFEYVFSSRSIQNDWKYKIDYTSRII